MSVDRTARLLRADAAGIRAAACALGEGKLVAFPTETVYGLGADAGNARAVARLYAAKGRPSFNPLIAHVADLPAARELGRFDDTAERLAAAFWPGALTLVVPRAPGCSVCALATAGLDTIAVRVPDHAVAHGILAAISGPVVAPSANRSGHVSPTRAGHVLADLADRIDLIIDDGPTGVGVESTIVACFGGRPILLRPGGIARAAIERIIDAGLAAAPRGSAPAAPGLLSSHYAPRARLRLQACSIEPREALLAFGPHLPSGAAEAVRVLNLSARGDLIEAAANLFAFLRILDGTGAPTIAVMPVPPEDLGEAINDRLERAAAPRADPI
jgi:L-threonylcarbamoyladenylate synthase